MTLNTQELSKKRDCTYFPYEYGVGPVHHVVDELAFKVDAEREVLANDDVPSWTEVAVQTDLHSLG